MKMNRLILASLAATTLIATAARAEDYTITLKDKAFTPAELAIPADQKVKITVKNLNPAPAEFESHELRREKVIGGGKEAVLFIGPLKAGTYTYVDEFQPGVEGKITAK